MLRWPAGWLVRDMRLFFALWPSHETAAVLERWARPLAGRGTPADKIHLTLAFLGEAEPERAARAARRVQGDAFDLPLEQARYWSDNHIVWAGPRETPPALARRSQCGGRDRRRPYRLSDGT